MRRSVGDRGVDGHDVHRRLEDRRRLLGQQAGGSEDQDETARTPVVSALSSSVTSAREHCRMRKTLEPAALERGNQANQGTERVLDADLAPLYGVEVRTLNQAVSRNRSDFRRTSCLSWMPGSEDLRSQSVISNRRGGRRYRPTPSRNRAWPCFRQCFGVRGHSASTSRSSARCPLAPHARLEHRTGAAAGGLERKYDGQFTMVFDAIRS
jgi:hypothetical protein